MPIRLVKDYWKKVLEKVEEQKLANRTEGESSVARKPFYVLIAQKPKRTTEIEVEVEGEIESRKRKSKTNVIDSNDDDDVRL